MRNPRDKTTPRRKKRQPRSPVARLKHNIRNRLLSGLIVIVPLGITVFVLRFAYQFTAGRLSPMISAAFDKVPEYAVPGISIVVLLAGLYLIGLGATVFVGRKLIVLLEAIIQRIPLVKTVYGASKQLVDAFSGASAGVGFKNAAVIEFPCPGMKALGFVTGSMRTTDGHLYYKVFVPTTPNVCVGLFEVCLPESLYWCNLSTEDAVKMIVSGGILSPERLVLTPATQAETPPGESDGANRQPRSNGRRG